MLCHYYKNKIELHEECDERGKRISALHKK